MVRALRAELGTEHGTTARVASQLGYGVESVRSWVKQADIDDGLTVGVSTAEADRIKQLEQEIRELQRANAILKRAASRSEEHTSELQSLMRISYAVFCLKKKK